MEIVVRFLAGLDNFFSTAFRLVLGDHPGSHLMDTQYVVAQLVEALHKLEGHGFDSQWCHWNFSLT